MNELLDRLGIEHPIVLAPLGGGPSTPELVAAVSNAGGLGILGAAYMTPDALGDALRRIRALTDRPFGVNLFAGAWDEHAGGDAAPMLEILAAVHERLELPPPSLPAVGPDPFPAQLEGVLDARPALFSFTFGVPSADAMRRLRSRGIVTAGTATTVEEARILAGAGADAVMAQGTEAGAHRGTFAGAFEASMVPTDALVRGIAAAAELPVIASGGLMDGRDVARAMGHGASAAALGTAFLPCPESGVPEPYRRAILAADGDATVVTRAFSGRPARGIENTFIRMLRGSEDAILPYPLQNALTRPMRNGSAQRGTPEFLSLWAGQGVARARQLPAAELVHRLVDEMREAGVPPAAPATAR